MERPGGHCGCRRGFIPRHRLGWRWLSFAGRPRAPYCAAPAALVPLVVAEPFVAALQGLSLRNAQARLLLDGQVLATEFGEMLFTHDGVSGPIILTLSKRAAVASTLGRAELSIGLKPALSDEQLDARLRRGSGPVWQA